ncbi:MAG: ABC transporter permease [bacterium]|nr:ABC transporter permease [bacterium]
MNENAIQRSALVYIGVILVFLYAPLLVMMLMAFNESRINQLPIIFDLVWFERLAQNDRLIAATSNSIILAGTTSVIATVLGTFASLGLNATGRRGKALLQLFLIPPITIPWLIFAVALLIMFFWLRVDRSLVTLMFGHVTVQIPYVILIVSARFATVDRSYEDAAASLGAPPLRVFLLVTLPLILPAVVAAFAFAFAISFDNFVVSYFLSPPGVSTLPIEIYTAIRTGFTPEINAVSTIVFVISVVCVIPAARYLRFNFN